MKIFNDSKGYSLLELLVVIAIIAILAGISIPVFQGQVEKAKETADISNLRTAYELAITGMNSGEYKAGETIYYSISQGKLVTESTSAGFGKGTVRDGGVNDLASSSTIVYDPTKDVTNKHITVKITSDSAIVSFLKARSAKNVDNFSKNSATRRVIN